MSAPSPFQFVFTDSQRGIHTTQVQLTAADMGLPEGTPIACQLDTLHGGKQEGSSVITLTVGDTVLRVVPTRAMAILDAKRDGQRFGWDSPVKEVVHPNFINQEASGGLGWLDGFNEMLVRCGYQWSGHPGEDRGEFLTLHGRIQNTPADQVILTVERAAPFRVTLSGRVDEKRFKFTNFEVLTELSLTPDAPYIEVTDTLKNRSNYDNTYQAIYHNNFGTPILEAGATLHVAARSVSPFNDYAATGLDTWQQMPAPTKDFNEMVFNIYPLADQAGWSHSLLKNAQGNAGIEVCWQTDTLPVLTIWKNTDTLEQGYVVGIEPGTSFAYNRKHQWALDLVPTIKGHEQVQFKVRFGLLTSSSEVEQSQAKIAQLQQDTPVNIEKEPLVTL